MPTRIDPPQRYGRRWGYINGRIQRIDLMPPTTPPPGQQHPAAPAPPPSTPTESTAATRPAATTPPTPLDFDATMMLLIAAYPQLSYPLLLTQALGHAVASNPPAWAAHH